MIALANWTSPHSAGETIVIRRTARSASARPLLFRKDRSGVAGADSPTRDKRAQQVGGVQESRDKLHHADHQVAPPDEARSSRCV